MPGHSPHAQDERRTPSSPAADTPASDSRTTTQPVSQRGPRTGDDVHEAPESGTLRDRPSSEPPTAPASKPPGDVHEAPESGTLRD